MDVVRVEVLGERHQRITFARDGEEVTKEVLLSTFHRNTKCDHSKEFALMLQKAAREADRDIAFRKHGKDFRKHCEFQSNYWHPMPAFDLDKLA